MVKNLPLY
ncbi:Protein of unknown function [Bacillus mycoides]|uniref:Uncharacterized protein n=1 Tax=Bacillus mycoides TaxID=1405 RepID=A0A1C4CCX7_BACMY|nr:Protein of unknown function [Bacillus mycoides]SCC16971.1 Protein of unknown function [Bacillus mycoides]